MFATEGSDLLKQGDEAGSLGCAWFLKVDLEAVIKNCWTMSGGECSLYSAGHF